MGPWAMPAKPVPGPGHEVIQKWARGGIHGGFPPASRPTTDSFQEKTRREIWRRNLITGNQHDFDN